MHEAALAIGDRIGDPYQRVICLCYLNFAALRRHDVERVRSLAPQALAVAESAGYPICAAAAKAVMAWLAWQDGRRKDLDTLSTEALEIWEANSVTYPFQWPCLFPLASQLAYA